MTELRFTRIADYLSALRKALHGADPALLQDALYDTEAHLLSELGDQASDPAAVERACARFGDPQEVAEAWRDNEARVIQALQPAPRASSPKGDFMHRTFAVVTDPHSWSALLYMLLSLVTGILYFTWVVTGLSLSAGLSILIIGVPVFLLFLASVRALALVEGRVVETLLDVRMPRRQAPEAPGTLWQRLRGWLGDRRTWLTMLYMILELPLGVAYFSFAVTALSLVLGLLAAPVAGWLFGLPMTIGVGGWIVPGWALPLCWVLSFAILLGTLHLVRWIGRAHAKLARAMLVQP